MPLPDLIEIVPLDKPVRAEITVPGSKSITNRALILAALADGEVTLQGALWSEDTQVMVEALRTLGFEIKVEPDPEEFCNRTIMVKGLGGRIPKAGTPEKPLELFVGNAGTAARFLAAMVCLGQGTYRLHGVPRMHERPQAALFNALRALGCRVDSANDKLPAVIFGESRSRGNETHSSNESQRLLTSSPTSEGRRSCTVSIEESSQFASALLLCAKTGGWKIKVVGRNAEESGYVRMTSELIKTFPEHGGTFHIELDASSGSYFLGSHAIFRKWRFRAFLDFDQPFNITVPDWPVTGWQMDQNFVHFISNDPMPEPISRESHIADSILTTMIVAPFEPDSVTFTHLSGLRVQECERVMAMRSELTKCGVKVIEKDDTLEIFPAEIKELHGAEIETYKDHRMAMCFAILGLKVPGIKIKNPSCVKKTFPNFFQKLAASPPKGLGVEIRDARTGRKLGVDELFAD